MGKRQTRKERTSSVRKCRQSKAAGADATTKLNPTPVKAGKMLRKKLDLMQEVDDVDLEIVLGPVLTKDLMRCGIRTLAQLQRKDPEKLYQQIIARRGRHVDRCVLYTYRCGRYVARTPARQRIEHLLLWYNWTDGKLPENAEELLGCAVERLSKSSMNKRAAVARLEGRGSDGPHTKNEVGNVPWQTDTVAVKKED